MNKPDKAMIQNWLSGELEGNDLRAMERWAEQNAEQLESEMGWDSLQSEIQTTLPKSVEPPYADFFNERIKHHAIEQPALKVDKAKKSGFFKKLNWLLAPTALAVMTVCFYAGTKIDTSTEEIKPVTAMTVPAAGVYTPVSGVSSVITESDTATVILLDGLDDLPESLDILAGESSASSVLVSAERAGYYF